MSEQMVIYDRTPTRTSFAVPRWPGLIVDPTTLSKTGGAG
jgi:hypothetical protein